MPSKIDSSCIGICTLNEDGICIGCGRTVKEIHEAYLESIGMKERNIMSRIATNFDHVNLNTKYLEETINFYTLLGLVDGPRPDFDFKGSWLYLDPALETACIHLVEVDAELSMEGSGAVDHIAFRCNIEKLTETQNKLDEAEIKYKYNRVLLEEGNNEKSTTPNAIDQLFIYDPNRVQVELNFRK